MNLNVPTFALPKLFSLSQSVIDKKFTSESEVYDYLGLFPQRSGDPVTVFISENEGDESEARADFILNDQGDNVMLSLRGSKYWYQAYIISHELKRWPWQDRKFIIKGVKESILLTVRFKQTIL